VDVPAVEVAAPVFLDFEICNSFGRYTVSFTTLVSGAVKSFCGNSGSAGESFRTMFDVFVINKLEARSQTAYSFLFASSLSGHKASLLCFIFSSIFL
jgi:hypothetical protein